MIMIKNTSRQRILFTGETIQSTQNIEKPLGGRGSAPNPAGGAHRAPPDSLACGEGAGSDGVAFPVTPSHSENPTFVSGSMGY